MEFIISATLRLLYSLMGDWVYITFRILNFADSTSEASFVVSGSRSQNLNPGLVSCLVLITAFVACDSDRFGHWAFDDPLYPIPLGGLLPTHFHPVLWNGPISEALLG